jgi:tRNA 2-selenouridine synthase
VSIAFLRALAEYPSPGGRVYVEDEGGRIGNLHLPLPLRGRLGAADGVAVIEEGMESRLDVLVEDYVVDLGARFEALKGEERGKEEHAAYLREGLSRIQKKLGGARHAELAGTMETAFTEQRSTGDTSLHRVWLAALLSEYYDPM